MTLNTQSGTADLLPVVSCLAKRHRRSLDNSFKKKKNRRAGDAAVRSDPSPGAFVISPLKENADWGDGGRKGDHLEGCSQSDCNES